MYPALSHFLSMPFPWEYGLRAMHAKWRRNSLGCLLRGSIAARSFSECLEALFYRISCRSLWSEAVRVGVCRGFRHWIKCQQVKSLHRSAFHDGNSQRTLFAVFLGDVDSPEGLGMISRCLQRVDGIDLLAWSVPE